MFASKEHYEFFKQTCERLNADCYLKALIYDLGENYIELKAGGRPAAACGSQGLLFSYLQTAPQRPLNMVKTIIPSTASKSASYIAYQIPFAVPMRHLLWKR